MKCKKCCYLRGLLITWHFSIFFIKSNGIILLFNKTPDIKSYCEWLWQKKEKLQKSVEDRRNQENVIRSHSFHLIITFFSPKRLLHSISPLFSIETDCDVPICNAAGDFDFHPRSIKRVSRNFFSTHRWICWKQSWIRLTLNISRECIVNSRSKATNPWVHWHASNVNR